MRITERETGDVRRLEELVREQTRAMHRDRLRMVLLALRGMEKLEIARLLGVAKSTVETWVYRYRDAGLEAVRPRKRAGRQPRLTPERAEEFKARFTAGPMEADGVCTLRGKDAVRILNDEFCVGYKLSGVYDLLHRLGLSCLVPRPRHEKNDPVAMEAFKQSAPPFVQKVREAHPGKKIKVYWMDEGRFGQQGTLTRKWAERGSRPTAVKQTKYEWVYCYAAVDPESGDAAALLLRHVDTEHMNEFLRVMSGTLRPDEHTVLVMDNAGWHISGGLRMPENITPLFLPPYSPELNPVERLWAYIKSHFLSNKAHADYQALLDAGCHAWDRLTPDLLKSICAVPWFTPGNQT